MAENRTETGTGTGAGHGDGGGGGPVGERGDAGGSIAARKRRVTEAGLDEGIEGAQGKRRGERVRDGAEHEDERLLTERGAGGAGTSYAENRAAIDEDAGPGAEGGGERRADSWTTAATSAVTAAATVARRAAEGIGNLWARLSGKRRREEREDEQNEKRQRTGDG